MSNYKLTFKLKQHTPIIHFQYDQQGATLRASELKPKLDKFLIEKLQLTEKKIVKGVEKIVPKEKYEKWFNNKEKLSLDYKMRVYADHSIKDIDKTNPLFLGNMGKGNFNKFKYSCQDFVKCKIIVFDKNTKKEITLRQRIEGNINEFFAYNNFGNRNGKGNGSLYIDEKDELYKDILKTLPSGTFYLEVPTNDLKKLHEVVNYYWKGLKPGINYTKDNCFDKNRYKKSYLYKYFDSQSPNLKWEKKYIKEHFFSSTKKNRNNKSDECFARALLGLPDKFSYMRTNNQQCKPDSDIMIESKIDISIESDNIERIKAPIIFKPILKDNKYLVFILIDEEFKNFKIYDNLFTFRKPKQFNLVIDIKFINGKMKYTTTKVETNQNWYDFIKTNDFQKAELLKNNNYNDNRLKYQLKDLAFIFSLPEKGELRTPNNIDLQDLIDKYHRYNDMFDKNKFIPKDFKWNNILNKPVKIKQIL